MNLSPLFDWFDRLLLVIIAISSSSDFMLNLRTFRLMKQTKAKGRPKKTKTEAVTEAIVRNKENIEIEVERILHEDEVVIPPK